MLKWTKRESSQYYIYNLLTYQDYYNNLCIDGGLISYEGNTTRGRNPVLESVFSKSTAHHYFTFWWIDAVLQEVGPVHVFRQVRITKYSWYKLVNGLPLSSQEMGNLLNLPFRVINSDGFAITKINANWGSRPVNIQRIRFDAYRVVMLCNRFVPKTTRVDLNRSYRVTGNPQSSIQVFNRATMKAKQTFKLGRYLDLVQEFDSLQPIVLPKVACRNTYDLVHSSGIRGDKSVGAAGILDRDRDVPKRKYLHEIYALSGRLCSLFEDTSKGFGFFDTSIYKSGGRNKKNFNKSIGSILTSRPVWMASPVQEVFCNLLVRTYVEFFKHSSVRHPFYIGKGLFSGGWMNIAEAVGSPDRICVNGDYSKWDSTVQQVPLIVSMAAIRQSFPDGENFDRLVRFIAFGLITHPVSLLGGAIVGYKRGMPSGHALTSICNCLVHWSLRNAFFSSYYSREFKTMYRMYRRIPIISLILGDDFSFVSTDPGVDNMVLRMGSELSSWAKYTLDMDLDPPYCGRFAVENPDNGGFEFLKVRFTRDMLPTTTSQELLYRFAIPESRKTELNYYGLVQSLSYVPLHQEGMFQYSILNSYINHAFDPYKLPGETWKLEGYFGNIMGKIWSMFDKGIEQTWCNTKSYADTDYDKERYLFKEDVFLNPNWYKKGDANNHSFNYNVCRYAYSTFGISGYNLCKFQNMRKFMQLILEKGEFYTISPDFIYKL